MCNGISNKIYVNESILNSKSLLLVLTLKLQLHTWTQISSQKKKKKKKSQITNHNIVFIILQFDQFMSLYNQNIIVHMSCIWR